MPKASSDHQYSAALFSCWPLSKCYNPLVLFCPAVILFSSHSCTILLACPVRSIHLLPYFWKTLSDKYVAWSMRPWLKKSKVLTFHDTAAYTITLRPCRSDWYVTFKFNIPVNSQISTHHWCHQRGSCFITEPYVLPAFSIPSNVKMRGRAAEQIILLCRWFSCCNLSLTLETPSGTHVWSLQLCGNPVTRFSR